VWSSAVGTEELSDFATMIGTELLIIDDDTTSRRFEQEIRWNEAYYTLGNLGVGRR
jgi:L-arabinose isomerase